VANDESLYPDNKEQACSSEALCYTRILMQPFEHKNNKYASFSNIIEPTAEYFKLQFYFYSEKASRVLSFNRQMKHNKSLVCIYSSIYCHDLQFWTMIVQLLMKLLTVHILKRTVFES
jgi:hypothetical protein